MDMGRDLHILYYKCHENTNRSHVPQLSKAPIPTSKLKYVPNPMQV